MSELKRASPRGLPRLLLAAIMVVVLAISLGELYHVALALVASAWQAAALVNSLLALMVLAWRRRLDQPPLVHVPALMDAAAKVRLLRSIHPAYIPSLLVLSFSLLLALGSRAVGGADSQSIAWQSVIWIGLIPVIEEVVFRLGFGGWFRVLLGPWWGAYGSALLFALAHMAPTIHDIRLGAFGAPLGPFLLGFACEMIYITYGRFWAIVSLHAACNATVVVFSVIDSRWLSWLGAFYL